MAVYAITGKLGTGKGKGAVQIMRRYLQEGRRVATNVDLNLEHLLGKHSRETVQRIPDKPSAVDLYAIGSGNKFVEFEPGVLVDQVTGNYTYKAPSPRILPGFDESKNGALVLDECGSWLNTRNFQDKGRADLLEWAIHARKYGWDVYFIMQNVNQVDKQIRESLLEYVVRMSRLDRMKIPVVSGALKLMTAGQSDGALPRMHIAVCRIGSNPDGVVADRWYFRGDDLNKAYDTLQVFSDSYPHGHHCLLPNYHRIGYLEPVPIPLGYRILHFFGYKSAHSVPAKRTRKQPLPLVAKLAGLPPEERIKHWNRLNQAGLI